MDLSEVAKENEQNTKSKKVSSPKTKSNKEETVKVEFIRGIRFVDVGKIVTYNKGDLVDLPIRQKDMLFEREVIRVV
jgi:hypothetical protein